MAFFVMVYLSTPIKTTCKKEKLNTLKMMIQHP